MGLENREFQQDCATANTAFCISPQDRTIWAFHTLFFGVMSLYEQATELGDHAEENP